MKTRFLLCAVLALLFASNAFAGWDKKPELRWQETYQYDARYKNHNLYINRLSAMFNYLDEEDKSLFKFTPFYEVRWNFKAGFIQRNFFGLEAGKDFLPWLYLGQAVQYGLMKEDYIDKYHFATRWYTETQTNLVLSHELFSKDWFKVNGYIQDKLIYDIRRGDLERNEAILGLTFPIGKYVEFGIDWNHIKRVKHYDSDTFEGSLTLVY